MPVKPKTFSSLYPTRAQEQQQARTIAAERYEQQRPKAKERGYDRDHRAWRRDVLRRDPVCVMCGIAKASHADHIIPISRGGARLDLGNGQGLCRSCHSVKTAREDGAFGNAKSAK